MAAPRTDVFKSPVCRLMYARGLFKTGTYGNDPKAVPKFTPSFIFDNAEKKFFEPYLIEVLKQMDKGVQRFKEGLIINPLIEGDGPQAKFKEGEQMGQIKPGLGKGLFFIRPTAQTTNPPTVWWKNPNVQETEETVYSGCYGRAILNVYAWKDGKGLSFGITGFQRTDDGGKRVGEKLFSGSGSFEADKWSETIEDDGPAPEATKKGKGAAGLFGGEDDDIPF